MEEMKEQPGRGGRVKMKANVSLILTDSDGKVKDKRLKQNLVVDAGLDSVIQQLLGATGGGAQPAKFNYGALGTGSTAPAAGDTDLETEIGTRQQDTSPTFPTTGEGTIDVTFGPGNGTGLITESGIFNSLASTTLLARTTFTAIDKLVGDSLQFTWTFTLS